MKLKPVIASYSGETFSAIRQCLTDDVLEVVASIAQSPQTNTTIQPYETAIHAILETTSAYYAEHLGFFETLLHTTTAGRQGVSPSHMMMHLWRYIRKVSARTLYDAGFFTDTIPEHGAVTIFYENDVTLLRQLLC